MFKILGSSKKRYETLGDLVIISVKIASPRKIVKKKDKPGWMGPVKIIQLERISVRHVPEGLSRAGAIRYIAESRSF